MTHFHLYTAVFCLLTLPACSLKRFTVDQTAAILTDAGRVFQRENDVELAAAAIPASLKTIEGFLAAAPEQRQLLRLLAENYTSYAFGFLEDEAEAVHDENPGRAEKLRQRALNLHLRARDFGLRLLALDHPELAASLRAEAVPEKAQLLAIRSRPHLEGLFWTANPWLAAINVGKSEPELVAQLGLVRSLVERCAAIDSGYYWGGAPMALGALEGMVPKALGGRPEEAKRHFDHALEVSGGDLFIVKVLYAKIVGIQTGDREMFKRLLEEVVSADPDTKPDLSLANRLAQKRARRYLIQIDDLFI